MTQGFAAGSFTATCAYYDAKTRPERGSEPFFLSTPAVNGEPDFQGGTYDACGNAAWTRHEYDVLGRPVKTTLPDASTAAVAYAGLVTTTTNAKGQKAQETRNAIGQVIQTRQANPGTPSSLGMTLGYEKAGGGSDANIFNGHGLATAIIATGMTNVHSTDEQVELQDMVDLTRLLVALLTEPSC